ncbi:hypothetical protein NL499_28285, partial [Klebsiella pneumoniae]|nr:hypothetical protein [Klebsiella pneumoniae]
NKNRFIPDRASDFAILLPIEPRPIIPILIFVSRCDSFDNLSSVDEGQIILNSCMVGSSPGLR